MNRSKTTIAWLFSIILGTLPTATSFADDSDGMRVVWQDREDKTLRWGDFQKREGEYKFTEGDAIVGFPKLDPANVELVQMERIGDLLVVGVRDFASGEDCSGWVALRLSGDRPQVVATQIDTKQGNPAHLYIYDSEFYVANDRLSGFTRISPAWLANQQDKGTIRPQFFQGGKSHITLAAVDRQVAYATHMGSTESGRGVIDVVDLRKTGADALAYSIESPAAGLHGAISNSGKVFFAPSDGILWIEADKELVSKDNPPTLHHLSLGNNAQSGRPNRTGAFTNANDWVLFVTGAGEESMLGMVQASLDQPHVVSLPIPCLEGASLVSPEFAETADGRLLAYVFQDRQAKATGEVQEMLVVIDLDPNGDRLFQDAKIQRELPVGSSRVDGHYGHHSLSTVPESGLCAFTNPGAGEVVFMAIDGSKILGTFEVGGMPTKIICIPH